MEHTDFDAAFEADLDADGGECHEKRRLLVDQKSLPSSQKLRDAFPGGGLDFCRRLAVQQGLQMIRKLGTFVEFSVMREPVTVDWTIIGDTKELNIHGAHLGPHCYPVAIKMVEQGLLPMDEIITHQLPLADFQQGIDLVASGTQSIKVTLQPT